MYKQSSHIPPPSDHFRNCTTIISCSGWAEVNSPKGCDTIYRLVYIIFTYHHPLINKTGRSIVRLAFNVKMLFILIKVWIHGISKRLK